VGLLGHLTGLPGGVDGVRRVFGTGAHDFRDFALSRSFAFSMAPTSSSLVMLERSETSKRRARSCRCFLEAFASTPARRLPVGVLAAFGLRVRGPVLLLRLPVVADFLVGVLQR